MHEPGNVRCHIGGIALRQHCELGGVVALERLEEIELDDDFRRRRGVEDFHAAGADIVVAVPRIDRALAALGAAVTALHRGILVLIRRPGPPLMKVVDQGEDFFRRRLDRGRAPDAESTRLDRGEDEYDRNRDRENDGNNGNDLEHGWLRICELSARKINAARVSTSASACHATTVRPTLSARDKTRTARG